MTTSVAANPENQADLAYIRLADARVQAFEAPIVDYPVGFRGGPVLGEEHRPFRHKRAWAPYDHLAADVRFETRLGGSYVYAGPLYDHFWHFMSEMVHRILPACAMGLPRRFLFVTTAGHPTHRNVAGLASYLRETLSFLGLGEADVVILNQNAIVEDLYVPRQGAVLNGEPSPAYLDLLRDHAAGRLDSLFAGIERPARLYVSRSDLAAPGSILGERYLESELKWEGFTIFRPEQHPVAVQLDHYRKADCVVFPEGSACHGTELLGRSMMDRVVLIPRTGNQTPLFEFVLRPRAREFSVAPGARYLGTLTTHPPTGEPLFHRGVAMLDVPALVEHLRSQGAASLRNMSMRRYKQQAAIDMLRYLGQMRRERWDGNQTRRLLRSFAARFLRSARP